MSTTIDTTLVRDAALVGISDVDALLAAAGAAAAPDVPAVLAADATRTAIARMGNLDDRPVTEEQRIAEVAGRAINRANSRRTRAEAKALRERRYTCVVTQRHDETVQLRRVPFTLPKRGPFDTPREMMLSDVGESAMWRAFLDLASEQDVAAAHALITARGYAPATTPEPAKRGRRGK